MISESSSTFYFDSLESATQGLLTVLLDAVATDSTYSFGSLSAQQILVSGLHVAGEIEEVAAKLDKIPGTIQHPD